MNPQDAIDLGREAMKACVMVGGPILLASLIIGILVGVVQAMTQVQDQTVSFVPKLLCLMLVIGLCLPWLSDRMVEFSRETLATPMTHYGVTTPVSSTGFVKTAKRSPQLSDEENAEGSPAVDESEPSLKSPFHLPHYRYSRLPTENLDG